MHAVISLSQCLTRAVTGSSWAPGNWVTACLFLLCFYVWLHRANMCRDKNNESEPGVYFWNDSGHLHVFILKSQSQNPCSALKCLLPKQIPQNPQHFWLDYNKTYIKESQRLQYLHRWLINRVVTLKVLAVNGVPGWDIKNKTDK